MRLKNPFSIIELMAVVLVILLLISLLIPTFNNLKMNARTALCKSNLRQIGILTTSYQAENGGYLPNHSMFDIPQPKTGNNQLYKNWNGHLLPYIDVNLPDKFSRYATVTKKECTRSDWSQLGGPPNLPPTNVLKNGWVVIDDAYRKGGYQDLKTFICPEIHQNAIDVAVLLRYNGIRLPRIQQLCVGGLGMGAVGAFLDRPGYDYSLSGGVPTTYLANDNFYGNGIDLNSKSKRMDEITEISQKVLTLEGGICDTSFTQFYRLGSVYYNVGSPSDDGLDLAFSLKNKPEDDKLSYVHDNFNNFWIMYSQYNVFYFGFERDRDRSAELALKFNNHFAGKASMVMGRVANGYMFGCSIISYIDPETDYTDGVFGDIFVSFLKANGYSGALKPFVAYVGEPNEFNYLTGNMNVLFGDGSAATKNQAWLCNNRRKIAFDSKE